MKCLWLQSGALHHDRSTLATSQPASCRQWCATNRHQRSDGNVTVHRRPHFPPSITFIHQSTSTSTVSSSLHYDELLYILSSVFAFPIPVRRSGRSQRVPSWRLGRTVVPSFQYSPSLPRHVNHRRSFRGVSISVLVSWTLSSLRGETLATADTGLRKPGELSTWVEVETSRPVMPSLAVNKFRVFRTRLVRCRCQPYVWTIIFTMKLRVHMHVIRFQHQHDSETLLYMMYSIYSQHVAM